jgi:D-hexose-6-phosphate mutarotase
VELSVTVGETLALEFLVVNRDTDREVEFECCLHTYLAVGDVREISISGLRSVAYLDKTNHDALAIDASETIRIAAQTDRTYIDTAGAVEVRDPVLGRTIRVEKAGSASTVVWNPWTTQVLPDMGADEYMRMVCVESGNVERNRVRLGPGQSSTMQVVLSTR